MRLMERIAVAVQQREPALLVGETGTGKTALAQQLASQARHCLLCRGAALLSVGTSQQAYLHVSVPCDLHCAVILGNLTV